MKFLEILAATLFGLLLGCLMAVGFLDMKLLWSSL
jgi:hypothetical protein